MKSLPARPSLDSLRKQAKKLAHDSAAGDPDAITRVRVQLPHVDLPLTLRNAQLVVAREYGYAGWQELTAEVAQRTGKGFAWAVAHARRIIHDDDVEALKQLLVEYPALLSWTGDNDEGGVLGMATGAYGDAFDPEREQSFTRAECAEVLIDAGAVVMPVVCEGILQSRARGLLRLFHRKGLLPHTLEFLAALGDIDAVHTALDEDARELAVVNAAFVTACRFRRAAIAAPLLDRSIALDPDLGTRIDGTIGRAAFVDYFIEHETPHATAIGLWQAFVMARIRRAILDDDLTTFVTTLRQNEWLLGDASVEFQNGLISAAALNGRGAFITALLDLNPAIVRRQPPPASQAIEFAVTYAHTDLIPILTRIWPLPDDLPHAAALGDLARVTQWFGESGVPALGNLDDHYPYNDPRARSHLHWDSPSMQQVLDVALAFAVINRHFDVADCLLVHGADINTNWNSHEPASILHHLVFLPGDYEAMRFLIDRGIDMTIRDYRWKSTAHGWALYGLKDEKMAKWLKDAEHQRTLTTQRSE
jgi:hypothetical protein